MHGREDFALDRPRHLDRRSVEAFGAGQVQEGLINRYRLDEGGELPQDHHDLPRHLLVAVHPRGHEHRVRALLTGLEDRHGGAHAEAAGLVAGGRDDPAVGRPADDDALAPQLRVVQLLHRGVEGIHVDVQNHDGSSRRKAGRRVSAGGGTRFTFSVAFRVGSAMFDKNVKNEITHIKIVFEST